MMFQYSQLSRVVWKNRTNASRHIHHAVSVLSVESSGLEDKLQIIDASAKKVSVLSVESSGLEEIRYNQAFLLCQRFSTLS